ncbi:hypothetical protein EV140_2482 [Microcella alkaliphila]|uniref:Uncharacterized protein n=1 Tax=Microcella alkaliphila TaxID=279828 RepID=A0A4Q7TAB1_9MICO|nr:hypothetical protein [Microcella alkaliphila]RZT57366.1 hypothetical protein EV140_2482 [Microcella alkaliphila]
MSRTLATAIPVWGATSTALVVAIVALPSEHWIGATGVVAASAVLLAFIVQVAFQRTDGVVRRLLASVVGIVIVAALASGLMLILAGLQ